jgi:hypothetical protein
MLKIISSANFNFILKYQKNFACLNWFSIRCFLVKFWFETNLCRVKKCWWWVGVSYTGYKELLSRVKKVYWHNLPTLTIIIGLEIALVITMHQVLSTLPLVFIAVETHLKYILLYRNIFYQFVVVLWHYFVFFFLPI